MLPSSIGRSSPPPVTAVTPQRTGAAPGAAAGHSNAPAASTPMPRMENMSPLQSHLVAQARAGATGSAATTKQASAMVNFLREHEGQFNYRQENYPDTDGWHKLTAGMRNAFASNKGEKIPLNCWGVVFYTQYKAGVVDKGDLKKSASAASAASAAVGRHEGTLVTAAALRADLIGDAQLHPAEGFDFSQVPPGSTVLFCRQHPDVATFPDRLLNSHAAIMLDHGQMAHIAQAPTSASASSRPALVDGKLEITTPDQVLALAKEMAAPMEVLVGHTNGPASFVKENLSRQ